MTMENEELDYSDEDNVIGEAPNTDEENSLLGMNDDGGNRGDPDDLYLELDCPVDYDQDDENASINTSKTDRNDSRSENNKESQKRQNQRNVNRVVTVDKRQNTSQQNNNSNVNQNRNFSRGRSSTPGTSRRKRSKSQPRDRSRSKSVHRMQARYQPRQHSPISASKPFVQNPWMPNADPNARQVLLVQPNSSAFNEQKIAIQQAIQLAQKINQPATSFQQSQEPARNIVRNQLPFNQQYNSNLPSLLDNILPTQRFSNAERNTINITSNNDYPFTRTVTETSRSSRPMSVPPPLIDGSLFQPKQRQGNFNNMKTFQNKQNNFLLNKIKETQRQEREDFELEQRAMNFMCGRRNISQTAEFNNRNTAPVYKSPHCFDGNLVKSENAGNRNSFGGSTCYSNAQKIQQNRLSTGSSNTNMNKNMAQREIPWHSRFKINANINQTPQNNGGTNNNQTFNNNNNNCPPNTMNNQRGGNSFSNNDSFVNKNSIPKNVSPKNKSSQIRESDGNQNIERERPKTPKHRSRSRSQDGRKTPIPIPIPEVTPMDKELVNQKKAERLQRFSNNAPVDGGSETSSQAGAVDWTIDQGNLNTSLEIDEDYLRGIAEQKRKREEIMKQKQQKLMKRKIAEDSSASSTTKKPNVSAKQNILNKKNPFESEPVPMDVDIKKEEEKTAKKANPEPPKPESSFSKSNVTFIRTISKSMEELGIIRSRPTTPVLNRPVVNRAKSPHPNKGQTPKQAQNAPVCVEKTIVNEYAASSVPERPSTSAPVEGYQNFGGGRSQMPESVLNGCIVKIMHLPMTTTSEDIYRMCQPFGKPLEIKLFFPKENSAAVRFSNPTAAESFFNRYHGEKVENLFLNLFVI